MADGPDHHEKIVDDSGWWVRRIGGEVSRIIVSNAALITIISTKETITLEFDGPFEGRLDWAGKEWTIMPDAYPAVTPQLLRFRLARDGRVESCISDREQPLPPNVTHGLMEDSR